MKIAIDVSPLETGHKIRGVGFYLQNLKDALIKYHPEEQYFFFKDRSEIPKDTDIVHFPYFDPFFITLPFFKKHKTVVTVHDLTPIVFPEHFPAGIKGNFSWRIQKLNLSKTNAIITDSNSSNKDVGKYTGIPSEKIHTVYLAAGDEFKQLENKTSKLEVIKKYNLPEKFVLYVGDVTWNKNLPRLVRTIKKTNIPLVMVGKSLVQANFDKTNIWNKDLIEIQKLTENDNQFFKLGFVSGEDLVSLYNLATALILPSVYEGFGLPVLEAMQSGCPVVTTKGGSISEVAGEAAYFVDGYNDESIIEGIKKVFADEKLQKELSRKGLVQAKKFSWEKTANKTIEIYNKVLSR